MKKKVDPRIRTLIENGVKTGHRNLLILIGDKGKDTVVSLHYILSKCRVKARPSVLWCYKKDLGFTTHRKKREKIIKKQIRKGLRDTDTDDPFELFIASTDIRYTYYKESHKVLGNTFGMCILQDFEALTPNLLARTIETVEGGGLIVFLLDKMSSLKQLYTKVMDVHSHFRTESNKEVQPRFNERFLLSLTNCENCLIMDDEMNVLPVTSHIQNIQPVNAQEKEGDDPELKQIKQSVQDTEPLATIIKHAKTLDQAKALLTFVGAISEKTLRSTVALTAARGRGKSAALGLAIATSVAFGYSNIFVTSPSPENLTTLFDFIFKGLDSLEYKEHTDYEIVQSTNPNFNKAIVRVNIFRNHRQTIQYIQPQDYDKLGQTELLVIDEAAAIPLPIVKNLMGSYLVFLSSTVNGYEGTGRSLSLKLIAQLREQSISGTSGRILHEVELKDPVRYARGDPVEKWLNQLLCLDASIVQKIPSGFPHPSECELYYVNRDTLFSYHKASEAFLQRLVALFVSSHYKNSPNDLMLMSDAPAHHIFVLLGPVDDKQKTLPEILCAVQVSLEGQISKEGFQKSLESGKAPDGDLIPWTISQQFQDKDFANLSGGRIVRIAAHPDYQKMGYGSRALELLAQYYQGDIISVDDDSNENIPKTEEESNELKPRKNLPPLLLQLKDRKPERLHYLGVSFGVTHSLYQFWKKGGYRPVYLRQTQNELTGEYTCIMLKNLKSDDLEISCRSDWLDAFNKDFRKRFLTLLGYAFKALTTQLSLSIINPKKLNITNEATVDSVITSDQLDLRFSPFDLKRLESYSRNLIHHHVILDMLPSITQMFFNEEIPINLSAVQCAVLIGMGLQHRSVEEVSGELTIHPDQCMALFNKSIRKIVQHFRGIQEKSMEKFLPGSSKDTAKKLQPIEQSLNEELDEEGSKVKQEMKKASLRENKESLLDSALKSLDKNKAPSTISIASEKKRKERNIEENTNSSENGKQKKKKKSKQTQEE